MGILSRGRSGHARGLRTSQITMRLAKAFKLLPANLTGGAVLAVRQHVRAVGIQFLGDSTELDILACIYGE